VRRAAPRPAPSRNADILLMVKKRYMCDVYGCAKSFSESGNLKKHKVIHSGQRPYACDFDGCGATFSHQSNLAKHKRIHSGVKQFHCSFEVCGASFFEREDLKKHERTHSGSRPYRCNVDGCGKTFAQSGVLKAHSRIHSGERPFVCAFEECGATFTTSSNRSKHNYSVHHGVRRFKCHIRGCNVSCVTRNHLDVHKRTHSGYRPFVCHVEGCGDSFAQRANLKAHEERNHSKEGIQRRKKQEEAMKNALVLGGYVESFERGRVPAPGQFCREVYFDHRCALARDFMPGEKKYAYVDFVVTTPDGRLVFLEVDEEQHGYTSQLCETTRMWNICQSIILADLGGDMNVFWLRVNPNIGFQVCGRTLRTPREQRFAEVLRFLDALKSSPSDPPIQIGYAFYDCEPNGRPLVLKDPEYHTDVLPGVVCISKGSQNLVQPQPFAPVNPLFAPVNWKAAVAYDDDDDEDDSLPPHSPKRARALQPGEGTSSSV
jgi:hypothetical protein